MEAPRPQPPEAPEEEEDGEESFSIRRLGRTKGFRGFGIYRAGVSQKEATKCRRNYVRGGGHVETENRKKCHVFRDFVFPSILSTRYKNNIPKKCLVFLYVPITLS